MNKEITTAQNNQATIMQDRTANDSPMNNDYNPETMTITIDNDTLKRLTTGTPFQRGINCLAMLDKIFIENDLDMLNHFNIPKKEHQKILKQMAKERLKMLKNNPPPGIDEAAIDVFYGE